MKRLISLILIFLFFTTTLNASYFGSKVKKGIASKVVSSVIKKKTTQKVSKKVKDLIGQKIHGNSLDYKGKTHVYKIKNEDKVIKVGESTQGLNAYGKSKRAEQQVRELQKKTGDSSYESKIIKEFDNKKDARKYEKKLIERTREFYGEDKNDKSILIGNKINR